MSEEIKKTAEQELLDAAKASTEGPSSDDADAGGDDGLTPEQRIINELKDKLAESDRRAKDAEAARDSERVQKDSARKEAMTAAEKNVLAQEEVVKNNLSAAKTSFESAQKDWEDAFDSGDRQKLKQATIDMNEAQLRLRGAEYNDITFKEWKEKRGTATVSTSESRFTKKEQAWIDENPRFNTDTRFRAAVYAAHEEAVQNGIEIDSDKYFEKVEDTLRELGLKGGNTDIVPAAKEPAPKREEPVAKKQTSSTAAPPGGSAGGSTNPSRRQTTFTMTPEMREAAAYTWPEEYKKDPKGTEEKYAQYQMKLQKDKAEGKR